MENFELPDSELFEMFKNDFTENDKLELDAIHKDSDSFTPSEYNGGQLDKTELPEGQTPVSVGIDWCELSLRGDLSYLQKAETYQKGDFKLARLDIRVRHFNDTFACYYLGELFGVLTFSPRSAVIPVEVIQFKIDNQHFYKQSRHRLNFAISTLLSEFELTFNNFTRLDIYVDFYKFNSQLSFEDFIHRYSVGQIETKGKITKWNPFYQRVDGSMKLTGFSMGSRSSDKFIRCYNKSLEIINSHKTYVKEYWERNGMNLPNDVYRFELQLTSKWFREVQPFKLSKDESGNVFTEKILTNLLSISSKDSLLNLLQLGLKNYFDFFIQDERKVRNDDKIPFQIFDWEQLRNGCKKVYEYVKKKLLHQKFTWRQKMIVARNLFREYVVNFQNKDWLKYCARIVWDYDLVKRWDKAKDRYTKEFLQTVAVHYEWNNQRFESDWAAHMLSFMYAGTTEQLKLEYSRPANVMNQQSYFKAYPHLLFKGLGSGSVNPTPETPNELKCDSDECPF